jgi:hypothetical protein
MIPLHNAYLCPGDKQGAHITDNARMCACGNTNLWPLSKILDRDVDMDYSMSEIRITEVSEWELLSDNMMCE